MSGSPVYRRSANEDMYFTRRLLVHLFVCLFTCYRLHVKTKPLIGSRGNITRDILGDKEEPIKFCKSSATRSGSRNF